MTKAQSRIAGLGLFTLTAMLSTGILAQESCPRCAEDSDQIVACLQKEWGEEVRAIGINERGSMVRTFVNETTRTWTVVTTMASGQGCINTSGGYFEIIVVPAGPAS